MQENLNNFWYLPSCGEMGRLAMACAFGKIRNSIQPIFVDLINIKGEIYWTSTFSKDYQTAFSYEPNTGQIDYFSILITDEHNVRPIASF